MKDNKEKKKFLQLSISPLTVQERSEAEYYIIKLVQKDYFGKLYNYVQSRNGDICFKVKKDFKIAFRPVKTLSVFCDQAGLLHSHSWIINADKTDDARFPIELPKQHVKSTMSLGILAGILFWQGCRNVSGSYAGKHPYINI